jgi:hypothetical protein
VDGKLDTQKIKGGQDHEVNWFPSTVVLLIGFAFSTVLADDDKDDFKKFPQNATFTTLITIPRPVEGLTGDNTDNLYIGGSTSATAVPPINPPCPIWRSTYRIHP